MIPERWREVALAPPAAWGAPLGQGVLRSTPEDFEVHESLGFEASGTGPHAMLCVRKRGANTEWVARELARAVGCKPFEVGFAGLKDRNALTTQFFTVPRGKRAAADLAGIRGEGFEVLSAAEHQRKLPRGALEGNRFIITVREFRCEPAALDARLARLREGGVPNYFGEQRFGREAGNLEAVLRAAGSGGGGTRGTHGPRGDQRGFMLSAARSLIFNAILADRVERHSWDTLLPGDVAILDGRGSVFPVPSPDETLAGRCAALEIHPTAPLVGDSDSDRNSESLATGEVRSREEAVAAGFPEALAVIRAARMNGERRATRIAVRDLEYDYDGAVLRLAFALTAGSFATTVLREIVAGSVGE
jgi:tRNA pseudouridine13 synthase